MALDQPQLEEPGAEMSFLEHLEALRWHLIRSVIAIMVFASSAFIWKKAIFDGILLWPKYESFPTYRFFCWLSTTLFSNDSICIRELPFELINIQMSGQFTTHLLVAGVTGLIIAFPYICWEFWRFVKPALYEKERNSARGLVFWVSFLFLLGISFGYFVITPLSVYFFGSYQVSELVDNQISISSFISTVVTTTFGAGLVFELPVIIYFLAKAGLVTADFLKKYRRMAYIIILILAAIITPPDVTSQILVGIPLFLLYEVGIKIAKRVEKKRTI